MLKGIPEIISPELLKVLAEMGHGDRIVIADGNFAAASTGKNSIVIRCDGHGVPELLDAILRLFPLDTYTDTPVKLMAVLPNDTVKTPIWDVYKEIISKHDSRKESIIGTISRPEFYDEAREAYAIIATSEKALYANIMLQKGVLWITLGHSEFFFSLNTECPVLLKERKPKTIFQDKTCDFARNYLSGDFCFFVA